MSMLMPRALCAFSAGSGQDSSRWARYSSRKASSLISRPRSPARPSTWWVYSWAKVSHSSSS